MAIDVDDIVLPANVVAGSSGTILTSTAIVQRARGIETRKSRMSVPRERFTLKFHAGQSAFVERLFRNQIGPVRAFLFDHADDNVTTEVELEKVTLGGVTTAQVRQEYISLSVYTGDPIRNVFQPLYRFKPGTLVVTVDDVVQVLNTDYTEVDGLLTFTGIIAGTIKASCEFYKIVRFADDTLDLNWKDFGQREIGSCRVLSLMFSPAGSGGGGGGSPEASTADSDTITADDIDHTADQE